MSVLLPQPRLPLTATPQFLDFGTDLIPPDGGATQRINKLGNRFALVITYPRLKPEPDARILMSALRQAKLVGALFPFPQPGLINGVHGGVTVSGAGQIGSTLNLHGFSAGDQVLNGQFFSVIINGQRYLHHATADTSPSGGGMALPIFPMLRAIPGAEAIVEFAQPYIEGTIGGNMIAIEHAIALSQPVSITITERA